MSEAEHTTHFESCGCSEAREAALRAKVERLDTEAHNLNIERGIWLANAARDKARIRELEEAVT